MRLANARLHIEHPDARAVARGARSRVWLGVTNEGRKSSPIEEVPVSERDLLMLVRDAATFLEVLRKQREEGRPR